MKGKTHSEETKEKIRKALLGRKISEETKEKLRNLNKGEKIPCMEEGILKVIKL